jgi:hypothetical protein
VHPHKKVYPIVGDLRCLISALTRSVLTILGYYRRGFSKTPSCVNAQRRGTMPLATIQRRRDAARGTDIVRERGRGATPNA